MIRNDVFLRFSRLWTTALIFFVSAGFVYGQTNDNHQHNHDSSHSHSHDQSSAIIDSNNHTHLPVDYSFRPNAGQYEPPEPDDDGFYWWKGNLHTHTLWSDGDQFPEVSTQWYYEHGYHFLALSDHNTFLRGKRWINMKDRPDVYELYQKRFGDDWIETRTREDELEVRLKPLAEVRSLFEAAGRFLMIDAEEITTGEHVVHVNATNILDYIAPETGANVEETIRLNIDAVVNQGEETGQEMIPHLNHPNFRNAVTAEDMAPVENLRLFEIYNGHRGVLNFGDENGTKDLDRVWDIVLTKRLAELDLDPVFGVAVDDAHHYENSASQTARPGRGWINVRSRYLTAEHMVKALEKGDFYSSSGVRITEAKSDGNQYSVKVDQEEGVDYTIQFIGTKDDYDASSEPYIGEDGNVRNDRTRLYSTDIGEVLQENNGNEASYEFEGDELYVRVKIISSKRKENYFVEGEVEQAWLQPLLPGQQYGE
ncbi:MAG: hypothetical protein WD491_00330 [Balneolales bacterium]